MTAAISNISKHQKWYYRRLNIKRIFTSSVGAMIGIGTIAYVSAITGVNFIMPPLGATCFIAFVIPDSAFARPRNIIGGHLVSSMIGIVCSYVFGLHWWTYALGVGVAIAAMQILRILHPPAAANPLLVMLEGGVPLDFLLAPVLIGSGTLSLVAALYNKLVTKHRYFRVVLHYVANISEDAGRDRLFKSR
ncbi:HPP family protein [Sporomusa aerivorans]|uniref:HPP family protein n=1 Tax=Sporomusa aerivorans TaxID=204936 RepID=UPI00352B8ABA